jgi:hypothetical protein
MPIIHNSYEDLGQAAKALKTILEADPDTISQLSPIERLLAHQIRKAAKGDSLE